MCHFESQRRHGPPLGVPRELWWGPSADEKFIKRFHSAMHNSKVVKVRQLVNFLMQYSRNP